MKMKNFVIFKIVIIFSLLMNGVLLYAQVTIGEQKPPETFSLLELVSDGSNGLRLPQLTDGQRDAMTTSDFYAAVVFQGMKIYNTDAKCIEYWNGYDWVSLRDSDTPLFRCPSGAIPTVTFMPYNLGALPVSTHKEYMARFAEGVVNEIDNMRYGSLFQWGRVADGHQYRSAARVAINSAAITYDGTTEQVTSDAHIGKFVYNASFPFDWRNPQRNYLWGNGNYIVVSTPGCGIKNNSGTFYQCTNWSIPANNPCPAGWRIPTQDEWERLCNYDCDPAVVGGDLSGITSNGVNTTTGFTWVPVRCNSTAYACYNDNMSWSAADNATNKGGYAIYRTTEWTAFRASYPGQQNLLAPYAPEPYLFLPAAGQASSQTGGLSNAGTQGNYWSSSLSVNSPTDALVFSFSDSQVSPTGSAYRGSGMSVRCVKD